MPGFVLFVIEFVTRYYEECLITIGLLTFLAIIIFIIKWGIISRMELEKKYFGEFLTGRSEPEIVALQKVVALKLLEIKRKEIESRLKLESLEKEIKKIKMTEEYKNPSIELVSFLFDKTSEQRKLCSDLEISKADFQIAAKLAFKAGFVYEAAMMGYIEAEEELEFRQSL